MCSEVHASLGCLTRLTWNDRNCNFTIVYTISITELQQTRSWNIGSCSIFHLESIYTRLHRSCMRGQLWLLKRICRLPYFACENITPVLGSLLSSSVFSLYPSPDTSVLCRVYGETLTNVGSDVTFS